MAGVLGIYGLITAVIINGKMSAAEYSAYSGYAHLGAGLTTTSLQNKYSYLNAVKRSINTSSTPLIILINESRLRLHSF
jgi:hypothetical protein